MHGADLWWDLGGAMKDLAAEPMVQADAFTARPCSGNPVAVVFTHRKGDTQWMQTVANENNLSETAFLEERVGDGANSSSVEYELRWFTPTVEIDLCGHATLGSYVRVASHSISPRWRSIRIRLAPSARTMHPHGAYVW